MIWRVACQALCWVVVFGFCMLVMGCDNIAPMAAGETVRGDRYEIAAEGDDLRAYEWTSPASGRQCIFVAGRQKAGLACTDPR